MKRNWKITAPGSLALLVLLVLTLHGCASGERAAVEMTASTADRPTAFEIPFVKYTLSNGLDVVLHRDTSDPIVAITTLVRAGSNREVPGKTGFAHFFEHMSFNDSENVPRGANRKYIGELGGTRNGGTWSDGTIYYEVVPKDAFEKLLWIDSDRLGYMINTVTEQALENEKQVVKNEKRQRVDNRPYGHTGVVIPSLLYPGDHPYHWPVIGSLADLQAATLEDVREFYERYYGAANATLVIAGDIDIEQTKQLVQRWFGEIRRGPDVAPLERRPVRLERTTSVFHEDNFATLPELTMTFPTVEQYHPDSYALDALGRLLSSGKRAPLFNIVVEQQQLAPRVRASQDSAEIAGTFGIAVRANEGVDLDRVKAAIEEALARFDSQPFPDKDLRQLKLSQETGFYDGIAGVFNKAFQLATYNEFAGDPGYIVEDVARIQAVTPETVMDAFRRYILNKPYVMTSFVPKGMAELAVAGATRATVIEEQIVQGKEEAVAADADFEYARTPGKFDRSEPPLGEHPIVTPPRIWTVRQENGLRVQGIENSELPLVRFQLVLEGGHYLDPPERSGAAALLADLLREGTRTRTPEELEDAIADLGARISVRAGREQITLSASGLSRNFESMLELATEMLLEPRWDATEFARLKQSQLTGIRQSAGDPGQIAATVFDRLLYGDGHIFAIPASGTEQTVEALTLDDLKSYYATHFTPSRASLNIAGDVAQKRATAALGKLASGWRGKPAEWPSYPVAGSREKPTLYFIDVPGSKQSVLTVGALALDGSDAAYDDLVFANDRLGSGSSARLTQLLRIEKGYTYGAQSWIPRSREVAPFTLSTSVRANVTFESLELIRAQLQEYRGSFLEADLETTRNLRIKQATREFETLDSLIGLLNEISSFDLPTDYVERRQQRLLDMQLERAQLTIERYIDASRMVYVVVGDGESQRERLAQLGFGPPIELDRSGAPADGG